MSNNVGSVVVNKTSQTKPSSPDKFNVIESLRNYIFGVFNGVTGVKALILDDITVEIIGLIIGRNKLFENDVFLFDNIDKLSEQTNIIDVKNEQRYHHLKAVCIVKPTGDTIDQLCNIIGNSAKYREYHIIFTEFVNDNIINKLAQYDSRCLVKYMGECYINYYAMAPKLFSFNSPINSHIHIDTHTTPPTHSPTNIHPSNTIFSNNNMVYTPLNVYNKSPNIGPVNGHTNVHTNGHMNGSGLTSDIDSIVSLLVSLNKTPIIRYQNSSVNCKMVANGLSGIISQQPELFKHDSQNDCTLLILDRMRDPIAPLLMQWTYQAMIHELLTITNNVVKLVDVEEGVVDEIEYTPLNKTPSNKSPSNKLPEKSQSNNKLNEYHKSYTLSVESDKFYEANYLVDYDKLCINVKVLYDGYINNANTLSKSLDADTAQFLLNAVNNVLDHKNKEQIASKHWSIVNRCTDIISNNDLMRTSELEQQIVSSPNDSIITNEFYKYIKDPAKPYYNKLKLILLYVYHNDVEDIGELRKILINSAETDEEIGLYESLNKFIRLKEVNSKFKTFKFTKMINSFTKNILNEQTDVHHLYEPMICQILTDYVKLKLDVKEFPIVDANVGGNNSRGVDDSMNSTTSTGPGVKRTKSGGNTDANSGITTTGPGLSSKTLANPLAKSTAKSTSIFASGGNNNLGNLGNLLGGNNNSDQSQSYKNNLIIFVLGGITYGEVALIEQIRKSKINQNKINIIYGGSHIHSSRSFLYSL